MRISDWSSDVCSSDLSSVVSNTPNAPEPLACGRRSIVFSRLKCAICSRKWTSWSRIGPSGPMVSELRSLGAGAPAPVVEPKFGLVRVSDMENLPYCLLRVRSRWRSRDRLALWPAEVEVQPPEPKIRSPSRPPLDALPLKIGRAHV